MLLLRAYEFSHTNAALPCAAANPARASRLQSNPLVRRVAEFYALGGFTRGMNPLYEIGWYGLWWILFIVLAYCSARHLGWLGILGGIILLAVVIVIIDVSWIFKDMRQHPENGRDADFVFWFGVLCRIALFNVVLSPVSVIGLKLRAPGCRQIPDETKAR